jgi:hypothetical protein
VCIKKLDLSTLSKPDLGKVDRTVEAIERFINLAGIAMGLLQYLALTQPSAIWDRYRLSHIKFHSVIGRRRITIQPSPSGLVKCNM